MSKTLIALNNSFTFNTNLFKIAGELFQNVSDNLYVGLLVKDLSYISNIGSYIEPAFAPSEAGKKNIISEEDKKKAEVISLFEKNARSLNLNYEIWNDFELNINELIKHSTYSDLLILNYQIFYNPVSKAPDPSLLYQILSGSRCPVLIIPSDCERVENIIFTYDNKESSVFAIKSFNSLFSKAVKDKIVSILTVMPSVDEEIQNEELLLKLIKHHYSNVGLQLLDGMDISEEISKFAEGVSNPLIVMGAYGRSRISNIILPSVAQNILRKSSIPMFIAHR